ncbi:hypothetical protein Moror_6236 [Moniliophthora roreri MCA 2997]|uniref:Uncharacterized protein n=1 Tax=Moniliophthora roreri (strain MCA 2997) TaxID=1381753 RepID=V2WW55_MONRO|nr:hypothetical protein Moror_6236 [Moniliophthora roreri MCA 2997]
MGENWKTFCQRRMQVEKSWKGLTPSRLARYPATGKSVHRIKVDEVHGFIITSYTSRVFGTAGLLVSDMNKDQVLWGLPSTYIKEYAHIEYQNGYLIFDRLGGRKEVWRLATISDPSPTQSQQPPPPPYPQQHQLAASLTAAAEYAHTYPRGHFVPHALLQFPRPTRAFRFVYPTLLVGGWDEAYCLDVPTRTLAQTISGTQEPTVPIDSSEAEDENIVLEPLGEINYVEVSAKHVFICGSNTLRIFDRQSGACVLDMPSTRRHYGRRVVKVPGDAKDIATEEQGTPSFAALFDTKRLWKQVGVKDGSVVSRLHSVELDPAPEDHRRVHDEFVAVHVSPCGSHFVAMLCSSSLVIVRDFMSVPLMARDALFDHSIQVVLGTQNSPAKYLAYDRGKVVVASTTGIFILDINDFIPSLSTTSGVSPIPSTSLTFTYDMEQSAMIAHPPSPLKLNICRIPEFNNVSFLGGISCLQISDSGIYLNWDPDQLRTVMWNKRHRDEQEALQHPDTSSMPGSFDDDNDDQDDTVRRQESQFLDAEDTFRKTMQRKGRYGVLPTGDLVVMLDQAMHWNATPRSTVCGVNFAVWD